MLVFFIFYNIILVIRYSFTFIFHGILFTNLYESKILGKKLKINQNIFNRLLLSHVVSDMDQIVRRNVKNQ